MKKLFIGLTLTLTLLVYASISMALPMLSDITGNSAHDGNLDTGSELFYLTDVDGLNDDATALLLFENAGYANINSFGIYGGGNSLELFSGEDGDLTSTTLSWNTSTNLVTNLVTGAFANIEDQLFGFYLDSGDGNTYYSQNSLNGGLDMMLVFEVATNGYNDLFGADLVLAFEDLSVGSDGDYNDLVVGMSDIGSWSEVTVQEVPEPLPLALIGIGLLGAAGARKFKK